jgi:hypothetical protein
MDVDFQQLLYRAHLFRHNSTCVLFLIIIIFSQKSFVDPLSSVFSIDYGRPTIITPRQLIDEPISRRADETIQLNNKRRRRSLRAEQTDI